MEKNLNFALKTNSKIFIEKLINSKIIRHVNEGVEIILNTLTLIETYRSKNIFRLKLWNNGLQILSTHLFPATRSRISSQID